MVSIALSDDGDRVLGRFLYLDRGRPGRWLERSLIRNTLKGGGIHLDAALSELERMQCIERRRGGQEWRLLPFGRQTSIRIPRN